MAQEPPKQSPRTQQPQAAQEAPPQREAPREPAFLVGRCRAGAKFSRGGITFTAKWQAFAIAEMPAETADPHDPKQVESLERRLRRILAEPMLDTRLATTEEVEGMADVVSRSLEVPADQLAAAFEGALHRLARAEARIAELEQRLKGDHPPRRVEDLPGYQNRVPMPHG